jgi:hypothetical protein
VAESINPSTNKFSQALRFTTTGAVLAGFGCVGPSGLLFAMLFVGGGSLLLFGLLVLVFEVIRLPKYYRQRDAWERSWICSYCKTIFP